MSTELDMFSSDLKRRLVRCVENAVGDDIMEDTIINNLVTRNSVPSRIWDFVFRNLKRTAETEDCDVLLTNRGPWHMCVAFERNTGCIITFMRNERFIQLRKQQKHRKNMHYIDILAKQFNFDLRSVQDQMSIFPHVFSDENTLSEQIHRLLFELEGGCEVVKHHVLVLFDTIDYRLTNIRAVMITPELEIADGCEQDWSGFIGGHESTIMPKVAEPDSPYNQPNLGLGFSTKSIARMEGKVQRKDSQEEDKKAE